jgi:transposase
MKMTVLGIDLAKNVFQLHGVDEQGNVVVCNQLVRSKLLAVMACNQNGLGLQSR